MGIHVALNHRTVYRYDKAITLGPQVIQLRPAFAFEPHPDPRAIPRYHSPQPHPSTGNWTLTIIAWRAFSFPGKTDEFVVDVNLVRICFPSIHSHFFWNLEVEEYPFAYAPALADDLEPYRRTEPSTPLLHAFLADFVGRKSGTVDLLHRM
jgi:hypothetical protein